MSLFYECEVDVKPCASEELPAVQEALASWGMTIEGSDHDGSEAQFWGSITLYGGKGEHEAHAELKTEMPGKVLGTRWLCREFIQWDEEIQDEEDADDMGEQLSGSPGARS